MKYRYDGKEKLLPCGAAGNGLFVIGVPKHHVEISFAVLELDQQTAEH